MYSDTPSRIVWIHEEPYFHRSQASINLISRAKLMGDNLKVVNSIGEIIIVFFVLGTFTLCDADGIDVNVCKQVSDAQLAAIYPRTLFPTEQKSGCQWSNNPGGRTYFQIGVIESQKNLRDFFHKEIPPGFNLKRINDLGDRGLMTVSEGILNVVVVREGNWVLISTADLLYIKNGGQRQKMLWDIYLKILENFK